MSHKQTQAFQIRFDHLLPGKLRIVRLSLRDSMTNTYLIENQLQSCNAPYLPIHCTVTRCLGNDYGLNGLQGEVCSHCYCKNFQQGCIS